MKTKELLTNQQRKTLALHAVGLTPEEIGDSLSISAGTVRKNLQNIKERLGWHKATELAGVYLCEFLNTDYEEIRKRIISMALTVLIFIHTVSAGENYTQRRIRKRNDVIEKLC